MIVMRPISTWSRRSILIGGGLVALLCAQILYGALALSALYRQYREPALSAIALECEDLSLRLGRVARLGREPSRLEGLELALEQQAIALGLQHILITDTEGKIITGWPDLPGTHLIIPPKTEQARGVVREFSAYGTTWLTAPIVGIQKRVVGHVLCGINSDEFSERLQRALSSTMYLFGGLTLGACLVLILLVYMLIPHEPIYRVSGPYRPLHIPKQNKLPRIRLQLYLCLVLPLVLAQAIFAFLLRDSLRELQENNLKEVASQVGSQIGRELGHIADLGLPLNYASVEKYIESVRKNLPWVTGIGISDASGSLVFASISETPGTTSILQGDALTTTDWERHCSEGVVGIASVYRSKNAPSPTPVGYVRVMLSPDAVGSNLNAIMLDTLTMTVIAMLFLIELLTLLLMKEERMRIRDTTPISSSPLFMRPVMFICIFAIELSISFRPLRLAELNPSLFGLPTDVVLGLPVSFEMFMVGLAIMIGGFWSQKAGWRPLFLLGATLVTLGNLGSACATGAISYIIARGCAGAGYGLINLAGQVFVVAHTTPENRTSGLAVMWAGLYVGVLCGSAFGGLVADRMGYVTVFFCSAGVMALVGLILWRLLPREPWTPAPSTESAGIREWMAFICDRRMAGLLILNIAPCAFVTVCLFQFFIPVSLNQSGVSPAGIGRVSMLYCLVIVYAGPYLARIIDRSVGNKVLWLCGAGLVGAGSVAILLGMNGLWAAAVSVILLGLCNAVVTSVQGAYALELPAAHQFGASRSMGIYNVAERLGQVAGPVTLGTIMAAYGSGIGLTSLAVGLGAMSLLFGVNALVASKSCVK